MTILFSIPDFCASIGLEDVIKPTQEFIPLGGVGIGWLLPAIVAFVVVNIIMLSRKRDTPTPIS